MFIHDETTLAWALADAATPHLSAEERNDVHVAIGVGEAFTAIRYLITSTAGKRIILAPVLVHRCTSWLDAYVGHEDERFLRGLVEYVLAPVATRAETSNSHAGASRSADHVSG